MQNLLFDIDHTLLNTSSMVKNLVEMITQETGLSIQDVERYVDSYVNSLRSITDFDFLVFLDSLPVDAGIKEKIQSRYTDYSEMYTKYDNVDHVLHMLSEAGYKIGIYSEGTPHFQQNKLKNLMINKFLDPKLIFIAQDKRAHEYLDTIPPSIIIDDNLDVCNLLASHNRHKPIYLKREGKKFTTENSSEVHANVTIIYSLDDLIDVLGTI